MLPLVQRHPSTKAMGSPVSYIPDMPDPTTAKDAAEPDAARTRGPGHDEAPEPGMTSAYLSVFRLFYRK